jgi:hypothetical protein
MKKYQRVLMVLGENFGNKYASQTLQEIIQNAAGWGEQSANGIMNFPAQLKQDNADLGINITISGNEVNVSAPTVDPAQFASHYTNLPEQIRAYVKRHMSDFPFPQGTTTLQFVGRTAASGVAQG